LATVNGRPLDPHYKKTVMLSHGGRRLELRVAQDLFSSHEVDVGTRLLLRTLTGAEHDSRRLVLDLGCGYGPIGLGLKATGANRVVHMVDRDALAVEYSRENAALNQLDDVEVYGSLGYQDVRASDFDLIASNIPAKAGTPAIEHLLLDAAELLAPGGLVAIVVIAPLEPTVTAILDERPEVEVVFRRTTASYAVCHYRFRGQTRSTARSKDPATSIQMYERKRISLAYKGIKLQLRTAYGLPEFDSLSFATELVTDAVLRLRRQQPNIALVLNPGQGYLASMLWAALRPDELRLIDRDLLALRFTELNLLANGCPPERIIVRHQATVDRAGLEDADLAIGVLRPKEPPESAAAIARQLLSEVPRGSSVVLGASSTVITRCLTALEAEKLDFNAVDRRRNKGFSAVVLERARAA
jgi:16S rRNA (guanine1207-N2)-methyltransferase